jgi:hypothetical protein
MKIGYDNKGQELQMCDVCKFTIDKVEYKGMIVYDDQEYAFMFEMLDDTFPSVYMHKVDSSSIEKIVNVYSTNVNDKTYEGFRKLITE